MRLNEILEKNSAKEISVKTNISENSIELLVASDFNNLTKAKTLGFLSILEREYKIDLSQDREQALAYYLTHDKEKSISIGLPMPEENQGSSKLVIVLVLALLVYVSWYFFTQYDKKNISDMLPFTDDKVETVIHTENTVETGLNINNTSSSTHTDSTGAQSNIVEMNVEPSNKHNKVRN